MADNLTIAIGADSTKLRSDLAVVQAQMRQFGTELRRAAQDSLKTGDTSGLASIAKNFEAARVKAGELTAALRTQATEHAGFRGALLRSAEALRGAREHMHAFGESARNVGERVFPHFREILALSVGVAIVEFVRKLKEANAEIRETENLAKALGVTNEAMEGLELVGAQAGLSMGTFGRALAISARHIGEVREETITATGQMPGAVSELRGNMAHIADVGTRLAGGMNQANQSILAATTIMRGGVKPAIDFKHTFDDLINDTQKFPATLEGNLKLQVAIADRITHMKDKTVQAALAQKQYGRNWFEVIAALENLGPKLKAATEDIEHSHLAITDTDRKRARAFNSETAVMGVYVNNLKKIVAAALGQGLIPFFKGMEAVLKGNADSIRAWAEQAGKYIGDTAQDFLALFSFGKVQSNATGLTKTLVSLGETAARTFRIFRGALDYMRIALDAIAAGFNQAFGTHINAELVGAVLLFGKLSGLFSLAATGVGLLTDAFRGFVIVSRFFVTTPLGMILFAIATVALVIYKNWDTLKPLFVATWNLMKAFGGWVSDTFTGIWSKSVGAIEDLFNGLWNWIKAVFDKVINAAKEAAKWVAKAFGASSGGSTDNAPETAGGHARGGYIRGPGSGSSDSIPAYLSNGEYVVRAASVARIGVPALNRINSGSVPKFAEGGLVGGGGTPLHLHLGSRSYAASASRGVTDSLIHEARTRHMVTTGRKPSWAGT
jgi:hypothetical protein